MSSSGAPPSPPRGEQPNDDPLEQSLSLPSAEHGQQQQQHPPPHPLRSLDDATLQSIQRDYPNLTELNLDNNELRFPSISTHLSLYLPSLRSLHLSFNHLARIPELGALTQLTELHLKGNTISHIEHLSGCRRLELLDLSQNQIRDLPSLLAELAGECPSLTSLDLQQNPLSPPQYRVALISLMGSLRTLDGLPIRAEEKAYLQLLAATHVDESSEGQQSEHRSAEAEQGEPSQWALTVPAGAAPVHRAPSQPREEHLHVQDVDELSDHVSSPLLISAGPSSVVSTPRGGSEPIGRAESAALAHAAAEVHHQRQEQMRRDEEDAGARRNMERIPPVELQPSADQQHAAAIQPFSPQDPSTVPALDAQPAALPSRYSSNYSSIAVSRAESPAVQPAQQPHPAQQPPMIAVPPAARSHQHAFHQPAPAHNAWQQQAAPTFAAPQLHYHLPPHPPPQVYSAPPPAAPSASNAALEGALLSQNQLVQTLQKELQEVKSSLAREQAHVRTVKAYYQPPPPQLEHKSASASAAPSLPHSRRPSAAPPAAPFASLLTFPPPPAPISPPASQALDSLRLELAHIKKQNELLQIQNETTQEILRMKDRQSEEVRRAQLQTQQQSAGRSGTAAVPDPDLSILWRDKVFALLVQNKSLLLTHASDLRGYKQQLSEKTQTITQMEQQALLMSKSNAALQNQLQLAHNEAVHQTQVQEHAHLLQTQALASSARTARDVQSIQHLLGVFAESVTSMEDSMRSRLDSRLAQFNSRLEFARKRVAVVQAIKGRKTGAPGSLSNTAALPAESEYEDDFASDDGGDVNGLHLRREIQRLQADRSLIYSSWQKEVSSLREKLYASASSLSSAGDALKSSESAADKLRSEVTFLRLQNSELLKDSASKVPESRVKEMQADLARKIEQLEAELAAVRAAMVELQTSSDASHRSHLKTQVELSQARHALSTAQTNAAELSAAKYDYLEEKLRRKEKIVEELAQDKNRLQERIKEMEQERILMRYGVVQSNGLSAASAPAPAVHHAHSHSASAVSVAPPAASSLLPVPSRHAPAVGGASASSISNLLFGSAGVPVLASYHPTALPQQQQHQQPPFSRPQPIQQSQWQPTCSNGDAASLPTSTGSLLHNHPIPAVFGASAAALEQQLSASVSAASTRQSSRMQSVAPSPARPSAASRENAAPTAPHIPPLQFASAHLAAASNASSARPPQGVSSPPLASMAARASSFAKHQHAQPAQQPSRPHSGEVSRKLSHLAALSARLLDEDDD